MSNVTTSFVRIRRRDNEHLSETEIEYLFNEVVTWHEDFGSYWVRISRKYRKKEKCLDIQFGSGKRAARHIKFLDDLHKTYYVVERFNDESMDTIFEYALEEYKVNETFIQTTPHRTCVYKFDQVYAISEINDHSWEKTVFSEVAEPKYARTNGCLYRIEGTYHCSNDRGWIDAYEGDVYSVFDEDYPYDYFVLKPTQHLSILSPASLVDFQQNNFEKLSEHAKLILIYKGREVVKVSNAGGLVEIQSADHWDNCGDEIYLADMKAIDDGLRPGMRLLYND